MLLSTLSQHSLEEDLDDDGLRGAARRHQLPASAPRHLERRSSERSDPTAVVTLGYLTELYSSPRFEELGPEVCT